MRAEKQDMITFKVPESIKQALKGIPNRSEFIRTAIMAALDHVCPLCKGTGILFPNQRQHWEHFSKDHRLTECQECHAVHLVCGRPHGDAVHDKLGS